MDPKYHDLLDPVFLDYALEVENNSAGHAGDITQQRQSYNDSCRRHERPLSDDQRRRDYTLTCRDGIDIAVRCYYSDAADAKPRLTFYLHGGGWVLGNLDSHDAVCADICRNSATHVVAIDYRLAPEHPFPIPLHDCIDAITAILDAPEHYQLDFASVVLSGDSAGANLAAASCLSGSLEKQLIDGLMMIYPGLGATDDLPSFRDNEFAPILPNTVLEAFYLAYIGGDASNSNELTSPLLARDFSLIPPCYISAANHDPLRDDAVEFAKKLRAQHIPCVVSIESDLGHGYLRVRHDSDSAHKAFIGCCNAVVQLHDHRFASNNPA